MAIRFTWLAALVLGLMVWNTSWAEARSRTQQTQAQTRSTATQAGRTATTRQPVRATNSQANRATAARRQTASRPATGRTASRTAGASRQQASASCRGRNCAPARRQVTWQSGLEPATNAQAQSCPAGTLATLARGHSDVVRCLPL